MEGVGRGKVRLLAHSTAWDEEFAQVKAEIEAAWGPAVLDIQHVGSTAISSICAKPILDVAVRLADIEAMDIAALTVRGYEHCGPQFGRDSYHLFVLRGGDGRSLRHIHCYDRREEEFFQLVGFRDYLNAHPDTAVQYEKLKRELAQCWPDDRVQYTAGKAAFIAAVYARLGPRQPCGDSEPKNSF